MSITQQLTEFTFNLGTLDLLNNMGKSSENINQMLGELGLTSPLIKFMQSNRMLLNSVLLRLQLYSEQNMGEQKVRSNLAVLNNSSVSSLLDFLYKSTTAPAPKEVKKSTPPPTPREMPVSEPEPEEPEEQQEEVAEDEEEESHFDAFFSACVRQSDDASHTVKMSAMYDAFTKWWSKNYEDEAPTKDELKEYLSERLDHTIKSIVSNVSLV